jgi:hypothetical protein
MKDQSAFDHDSLRTAYSGVVFSISNDLVFWQTFLPVAIQAHREKYPEQTRFFESGLYAYNINLADNKGWLHGLGQSAEITSENLDSSRERFFMWIRLLSIVRIYNALELLLYGIIETRYLPPANEQRPLKRLKTLILTELKQAGIPHETKNNGFLLAYLQHRSPSLAQFFSLPVPNLSLSRMAFFEFQSLIRHMIVHDAMLLSRNNHNLLKSRYCEFMDRYFLVESMDRPEKKLLFNDQLGGMQNLLGVCDDLGL